MKSKNTVKVLALKFGVSESTIHYRSKKLKLKPDFEGPEHRKYKVWTDKDAELIKNWVGEKPGVKKKPEYILCFRCFSTLDRNTEICPNCGFNIKVATNGVF